MDAREALDQTIIHFGIHAGELAKRAGVRENELSRWRRGHNDVLSAKAFDIIRALPAPAQLYFWSLIATQEIPKQAIAA